MKVKRFAGDKILYVIAAVALIALGIVLIPGITDWGQTILNYVVAACIVAYICCFLLGKLRRSKKVILLLTVIEVVLMALIALGLVLSQFDILHISGVCVIIGFALACRGVVEMFRAYFYQAQTDSTNNNAVRYPLWQFIANLMILILGVFIVAKPFISDKDMIMVMVVLIFVLAVVCIALAAITISQDKKKKK